MSYCKREGKDKSVFVTPEDADKPAMVKELVEEEGYGIILPNGEINWDCPCLGGMAKGTCGQEFKDAFSCFHYSKAEVQGSDCLEQFRTMQSCFFEHPEEYGEFLRDDEEEEERGKEGGGEGTSEQRAGENASTSGSNVDKELAAESAPASRTD